MFCLQSVAKNSSSKHWHPVKMSNVNVQHRYLVCRQWFQCQIFLSVLLYLDCLRLLFFNFHKKLATLQAQVLYQWSKVGGNKANTWHTVQCSYSRKPNILLHSKQIGQQKTRYEKFFFSLSFLSCSFFSKPLSHSKHFCWAILSHLIK